MEGPPRRSTSLNFGLSDLFLGSSYPPTFNLVPSNQKMSLSKDFGSLLKCPLPKAPKLSHSLSIDDTINSISDTKNNLVKSMNGMFGSLKNLVSKIPNFMSNINNPLSVTVVPNEGIISPEDILHNLTRSSENLKMRSPGKFTATWLSNSSTHKKFQNVDDILVKNYEDFYYQQNPLKSSLMSSFNKNPLSAVQKDQICTEDVKDIKAIHEKDTLNLSDAENQIDDLVDTQKVKDFFDTSSDSSSGNPFTVSDSSASSLKPCTSIKYAIRSRKPSESSTDSDDSCFIVFEDSQSELNCDYESLSDEEIDEDNVKRAKSKSISCMSVRCDFRSKCVSESSIDSEDSCVIVFKDECEFTDFNCKLSSDDDDEFKEDKKSGQKVRFNLEPVIHNMIQWNFAYRAARLGPWEEIARDRDRFRKRVDTLSQVLNPILTKEHRESIWHARFPVQD